MKKGEDTIKIEAAIKRGIGAECWIANVQRTTASVTAKAHNIAKRLGKKVAVTTQSRCSTAGVMVRVIG